MKFFFLVFFFTLVLVLLQVRLICFRFQKEKYSFASPNFGFNTGLNIEMPLTEWSQKTLLQKSHFTVRLHLFFQSSAEQYDIKHCGQWEIKAQRKWKHRKHLYSVLQGNFKQLSDSTGAVLAPNLEVLCSSTEN